MKGMAKAKVLPLNVKAIKAAIKAAATEAKGKPREFRVKGSRNLVLIVQASGKASWYCFYFIRQGAKRRLRKWWIGTHEHTPLPNARLAAGEVMRKVEAGGDPLGEAEARRGALTLRELFKQRREFDHDTAARTLDGYSKALELDVFSRIGDVPAVELTSDQIADVLERIERRSRHSAHRARCAISSTFRWAQRKGKLRRNPVVGLGFTVRPIPRDRVFTDVEMRKLWHGIEREPELSPAMRAILKLALLTGLRESEVAGARLAELRLEGSSPRWTIKRTRSVAGVKVEGRMKRKRRDHILPLTPVMVALLKQALELNLGSEYVFPADMTRTRNGKEPRKPHVNGESVSHAMRRLRERIELEDARVHDFRACLTTWLSDNGYNREVDVRKVILHHAPTNVTDAHYDFAKHEAAVRRALTAWGDHIAALAKGQDAGAQKSADG